MKKESTFLNMVLTLFGVTLIASASLGYVYELTKDPIAAAALEKKIAAIKKVVPDFTNNPLDDKEIKEVDGDEVIFYPAKNESTLVGIAIETFTNLGFGGTIKLMVGILPNGTIKDIAVLEQKETPGLGDKMQKSKSDFSMQFNGKNPANYKLKVKKDGGDVDAITAATISSRAFCDAVKRAYNEYIMTNAK
ncbi:MAG: RnfABCDGE type electron transport complex subunit G [Candidatus Zapsychrus exili]|nr:RnfABCDGE type electron transport complex subunit G [Candidatus Zapsychrus exili]